MNVYCRICGAPGANCGPSHQTLPLLDITPLLGKERITVTEPQELKEYKYRVGAMETTAMLTEEMAERLGAVGVDEELPEGDTTGNKESERLTSENADALQGGVAGPDEEAVPKARIARNKRSGG